MTHSIGTINLLGINSIISTIAPVIKASVQLIFQILSTGTLLIAATLALNFEKTSEIVSKGEVAAATLKLIETALFAPLALVYSYWNKAIAPALYTLTGREYYLKSAYLDTT